MSYGNDEWHDEGCGPGLLEVSSYSLFVVADGGETKSNCAAIDFDCASSLDVPAIHWIISDNNGERVLSRV